MAILKPTPFKLSALAGVLFAVAWVLTQVLAWQAFPLSLFPAIDRALLDAKFRIRGPVATSGKVTLCEVDVASLKRKGGWPWRRELTGQALKNLNDAGALAVGASLWFPEPSINSAESDERLAELLRQSPRVVLGTGVADAPVPGSLHEVERFALGVYARDTDGEGRRVRDWSLEFGLKASAFKLERVEVEPSIPLISAATSAAGLLIATADSDGVLRSHSLLYRSGELILPSFPLATAAVALRSKPVALTTSGFLMGAGLLSADNQTRVAFVTEPATSKIVINYPGPADPRGGSDPYPRLEMADAVDGTFDRALVKDRVVLVGITAPGLGFTQLTPFGTEPALSIDAAVVDNLMSGNLLVRGGSGQFFALVVLLVLALTTGLLFSRVRTLLARLAILALLGAIVVIADYQFFLQGVVLPTSLPLTEIGCLALVAAAFRPRQPARASAPLVFDKYEIIRRLAVGGMGEIFLARQHGAKSGIDRLVVIKGLLPDLAEQPGFLDQFLDEARVAAVLNHPNIVSIVEVGDWRGTCFIVMEYVDGESLAQLQAAALARGRPVPRALAVRIVHDAALALDFAHHAKDPDGRPLGIVHRDVTPQNIMVRTDGVTKVVDFGVALAANRVTRTVTGDVKGKLAYMPPEQIQGERLDGRTDQWALGVVLWELLAGRRLFRADNDALVIERVLRGRIDPPGLHADVPPALDAVVMQMLQRDPKARFARLAEVAGALEKLLEADAGASSQSSVAHFVEEVVGERVKARTRDLTPSDPGQLLAGPGTR